MKIACSGVLTSWCEQLADIRKRLDHHVWPNVKHGTFYQNQKELEKAVPVLQKNCGTPEGTSDLGNLRLCRRGNVSVIGELKQMRDARFCPAEQYALALSAILVPTEGASFA